MTHFNDQQYLRRKQYADSSRLNARVAIHVNYSVNKQGWFSWLAQHYDLEPGQRVLELGGGPGHFWRVAGGIKPGVRLTFSDFSPGMVREARAVFSGKADVTFAVIDAQAIPFPELTFDRVIANHMLYHVPDRERAIREVHRVLKSGGVFYAATNGSAHLRELTALQQEVIGESAVITGSFSQAFSLENGAGQLAVCFPRVELFNYPDALHVTEVEPIIDYLYSMNEANPGIFKPELLAALRRKLQQQIDAEGAVHIRKQTGLFIAHKDD